MTREQWERLKTFFEGALDQPRETREAWLLDACAADDALRREAEALLRTYDTIGDFLEVPARIDPADLETLPAETRLGPYRILEEIGRGGMGIVYLADDTRLGRRVALKALPAEVAADAELRERLRREARAAATISHPSVATVYALEEVDDHLIIVSEYVRGETLRTAIARGPMDTARAGPLALQIASGLAAAHEAGVIHRDLKPENVLVTAGGDVKIVDFGIAHVEGQRGPRLTGANTLLGTPAYMAPEQLLGAAVDARADLYAFGVMLGEMLAGRHPLSAPIAPQTAPDPGDQAREQLVAIADRCMQADPSARFPSARELLEALTSAGRPLRSELGDLDPASPSRAPHPEPRASGPESRAPSPESAHWWWEFHQAVAALVYWLMTVPAWRARDAIGGEWGRAFFVAILIAVIVAANLRLHLWFTSRFYPAQLRWVRRRTPRWIRAADWVFVATLAVGAVLMGDRGSALAALLLAVSVGTALAFLVIEPVTARAAFKGTA
jgi:serine/threonine protein kinase